MSNTVDDEPELDEEQLTMGLDPWERNWIRFSIGLLIAFAALITIAGFTAGFQLPGAEARVDPETVTEEGPFAAPGLYELAPGEYEAFVLSQTWTFSPREIVVPVGSEVTIYVTSSDLQHGFKITDTNVNMQVVPGEVSKLNFTFDDVGDFPYICTEYCGSGHAAMFGTVKVLSQEDFDALQTADEPTTGDQTESDDTESTGSDG